MDDVVGVDLPERGAELKRDGEKSVKRDAVVQRLKCATAGIGKRDHPAPAGPGGLE